MKDTIEIINWANILYYSIRSKGAEQIFLTMGVDFVLKEGKTFSDFFDGVCHNAWLRILKRENVGIIRARTRIIGRKWATKDKAYYYDRPC